MKLRTRILLALTVVGLLAIPLGGCNTPTGRQFRDAALPNIESGVQAILSGFVDGVFAAIETEPDDADDMMSGA